MALIFFSYLQVKCKPIYFDERISSVNCIINTKEISSCVTLREKKEIILNSV